MSEYVSIQESLAKGSLEMVSEHATNIRKLCMSLGGGDKKIMKALMSSSTKLAAAKDLKQARMDFKTLSAPIVSWVKEHNPDGYEVVNCSMEKADWVQKRGDVKNPYLGKSMPTCGEKAS